MYDSGDDYYVDLNRPPITWTQKKRHNQIDNRVLGPTRCSPKYLIDV